MIDVQHDPTRRVMPESPDFDAIARAIGDSLGLSVLQEQYIVEQLRIIWNARGLADIDALLDDAPVEANEDALRSLDR